jgi:hypothetical protein
MLNITLPLSYIPSPNVAFLANSFVYVLESIVKHIKVFSLAPVAHACNPSYSGGQDQEVGSSKPAWANSS